MRKRQIREALASGTAIRSGAFSVARAERMISLLKLVNHSRKTDQD
ncbi:hypothetical protein WDW37_19980 [Bdellovibrionota bacterium FG-1]